MIVSFNTEYLEYAWEILGLLDDKSGRILMLFEELESDFEQYKSYKDSEATREKLGLNIIF